MGTFPSGAEIADSPSPAGASGVSPPRARPVRPRTYLIGVLLVIVVCIAVAYSELVASRGGSVQSVMLGSIPMAPAAVGMIIILLSVNAVLRRFGRSLGLNPAEMGVIYFMLVCAAMISSFGLAGLLLPNLMGPNYYASSQDHAWKNNFYPHVPRWLVPWDPHGPENQWVSQRFFEGLRVGEHVPWGAWLVPVLCWTGFAFLLFFLMACVTTLLRRQWVDNEKLSFPLVQLPMEMINDGGGGSFFSSRAMWLGFAIPLLLHTINGLHKAVPSVPEFTTLLSVNDLLKDKPWSDISYTLLVANFSIIGFAYLLPLDVSFSMWFFLLFFRLQDLIGSYLGYEFDTMPFYPATRYYHGFQSAGAFFVIALAMIWWARPHLRAVLNRLLRGEPKEVDADEFMGYRTAFFGGLFSFLLILLFLKAAGMSPVVALFVIGAFVFVIMLVLTRCVSEVGLLMLQPVVMPVHLWSVVRSPAVLGQSNLAIMAFLNGAFFRDPRNVMPALMDSMKASDLIAAHERRMAIGLLLAVAIGIVFALLFQIGVIYKYGGLQLNKWFFIEGCPMAWRQAQSVLDNPSRFDTRAPLWFAAGGVFTLFLYTMRARFWWWPFHPLGYAMGCAWPAIVYWTTFFVGWLIKSIILHYGGATTYRNFRPFFLGLILGEFSAAILWAILSGVFGLRTPNIPIS